VSTIRGVIWILSAFLFLATLDSVPDPPAASPLNAKSGTAVAGARALAPDIRGVSLPSALALPEVCFTVAGVMQADSPARPTLTLTNHATDPSPPLFLA